MAVLAKRSGIGIVIASILPASTYPWNPGLQPAQEIRDVNRRLRDFCETERLVYLDYYAAMADERGGMRPGLSFDGVHPTAKGYAVMSPLAEQAISRVLLK